MTILSIFLAELSFCLLKIDFYSCFADWNLSYLGGQRCLPNMLIWTSSSHRKANYKILLVFQDKKANISFSSYTRENAFLRESHLA